MFDAKLRLSREAGKYPSDRSVELRWMLVSTVEINGTKALVMFDSGAEMDALSPDFVRACHIPVLELPSPLVLQMGTKGSRSCIYYGTNVNLKVLGHKSKHYFDVVNIDRYDAILGAPWLNTHGVVLDFKNHIVSVGAESLPTLDALKERSTVSTGASARRQHYGVAARPKGATQTLQR